MFEILLRSFFGMLPQSIRVSFYCSYRFLWLSWGIYIPTEVSFGDQKSLQLPLKNIILLLERVFMPFLKRCEFDHGTVHCRLRILCLSYKLLFLPNLNHYNFLIWGLSRTVFQTHSHVCNTFLGKSREVVECLSHLKCNCFFQ